MKRILSISNGLNFFNTAKRGECFFYDETLTFNAARRLAENARFRIKAIDKNECEIYAKF